MPCYAPGNDLPAVIQVFLDQPEVFIIKNRVGGKMIPHQRRPEFSFATIFLILDLDPDLDLVRVE